MIDLLKAFSLSQLAVFVTLLILAIKGLQDVIDFFKGKYKEKFNADHKKLEKEKELDEHFENCKKQHDETLEIYDILNTKLDDISDSVHDLRDRVDELTVSDMHSIKQFIVREYHYFVEQKKQIDDYSLDCVLLRYNDYKKEGGNSYIETLVEELKNLPKHPPKE